jgi:outer membrane lipoprotein carrier protein
MGDNSPMRLIPSFLGSLLAALSISAQATGIERLKAFLDHTQSARASFSQTVIAKSGKKPQQASGQMMFARPGKFRWVYEKPYAQLLVGDGDKLWIYDKDLNQVTVKKLGKALGESPAALLAGQGDLEKHFNLREGDSKDGLEWVEATPKAKEGGFERLRIGFEGEALRSMEIQDNFGQTTVLVFGAMERNPGLAASLFKFAPPKGADVVGE